MLFKEAATILFWTPLYVVSMPGIVMQFIEKLAFMKGEVTEKQLGFFIQSGFIEATHSRALEAYFKKLTCRLGARYMGTAIKGGAEGLTVRPSCTIRKLQKRLELLGTHFGLQEEWDEALLEKIAGQEHLNRQSLLAIRALQVFGLGNGYWNYLLKKHGAFDKRFAQPYGKKNFMQ